MNDLGQHLQTVQGLKRQKHHPLLHEIHRKFRISRKTLFYIKEYGPHTHIARTIVRESIKILLFASVTSSVGGLALEHIKYIFVAIVPLTILLPTLNDMIGDYGTILSSRFSTMLHEGKSWGETKRNPELKKLIVQIFVLSQITALLSAAFAILITKLVGREAELAMMGKIFLVTMFDAAILIAILSLTAITAGLYFYKKNEDPNNFLIPIATSIADFGNMIILALLVAWIF